MEFPSYRNKSVIDPSQALIDPQIDGVSLGIHQLPSGESCYWRQLLCLWLWVKAIRLLRPSDNRLSLKDRPSRSIHQTLMQKLKQPPKVSRITSSDWSHPDNTRAFPITQSTQRKLWPWHKMDRTCYWLVFEFTDLQESLLLTNFH